MFFFAYYIYIPGYVKHASLQLCYSLRADNVGSFAMLSVLLGTVCALSVALGLSLVFLLTLIAAVAVPYLLYMLEGTRHVL